MQTRKSKRAVSAVSYKEQSQDVVSKLGKNDCRLIGEVMLPTNQYISTVWNEFYRRGDKLKHLLNNNSDFVVLGIYGMINVGGQCQAKIKMLSTNGIEDKFEILENLPIESYFDFIAQNLELLKKCKILEKSEIAKIEKLRLPETDPIFKVGEIVYHQPLPVYKRGKPVYSEGGEAMVRKNTEHIYAPQFKANVEIVPFNHTKFCGGETSESTLRKMSDLDMNQSLMPTLEYTLLYNIKRAVKVGIDIYPNLCCIHENGLTLDTNIHSSFYGRFYEFDNYYEIIQTGVITKFMQSSVYSKMERLAHISFGPNMNPNQLCVSHTLTYPKETQICVFFTAFEMDFVLLPMLNQTETNNIFIQRNDAKAVCISISGLEQLSKLFFESDLSRIHSQGSVTKVETTKPVLLKYLKKHNTISVKEFWYETTFPQSDHIAIID